MKKWSLRPDPSAHDPHRYALLIKGEMKHVVRIVKKFGAMCGRPRKVEHAEGFDFLIHLHGLTQLGLEKVSKYLEQIAPGSGSSILSQSTAQDRPVAGAVEGVTSAPDAASSSASGDKRTACAEGAGPFGDGSPMAAAEGKAEPPAMPRIFGGAEAAHSPAAPDEGKAPAAPESARSDLLSQLVLPAAAREVLPAAEPPAMPPIFGGAEAAHFPAAPDEGKTPAAPEPAVAPIADPRFPRQGPVSRPVPFSPPSEPGSLGAVPEPAAQSALPGRTAEDALWGLRLPWDPRQNFDTLVVGSHNRFAHAAATSVVNSPGVMYNPLFIYGVPGVGKTHVLHAVGSALGKALGEDAVILTSGSNLARAVSSALAAGKLGRIEEFFAAAKALLVDDVHLMAISEKNQAALAQLFQKFFARTLQVVFTSAYPPRALGMLEEALKLSLSKGWAVDMKVPNPLTQKEILEAYADRRGASLSAFEVGKLQEELGPAYAEFPRTVSRLLALKELRAGAGKSQALEDILQQLLKPGERASREEVPGAEELDSVKGFAPPLPTPDARPMAIFYPKSQEMMIPWILALFYRTAAQLGLKRTYRQVLCEAYDADQPFGVPFQIGESCRRCAAQVALVLGPASGSSLSGRVAEFAHAVRHILESAGVVMGWLPFSEIGVTRPFVSANLDFIPAAKK